MNMILNMTALATAGDNSEGRLDVALGKMALLGKAEAVGAGSRRDAGIALTAMAYDRDICEDDAEALYNKYQAEFGKLAEKKHLTGIGDNPKSHTAQVSKFRAFIKLGALPSDDIDGREILARAMVIAKQVTASGNKVLSPFEALRTVCVAQCAQPDAPLTDEQIMAAVSKNEPAEKDALAKLVAAYKSAYKLNTDLALAATQDAVDAYAAAIREIDEDGVPAMTKEEKKEMEFRAEAKKRGMI